MEKCTEEESMEFASCQNFTDALISIVDDFNKRIVPTQSSHNQSSFSSHYCYELSLFMLLGLLDKTTLLVAFVKATSVHRINECIQSICSTILHDHLYLTQVRHTQSEITTLSLLTLYCFFLAGSRFGDCLSHFPLLPPERVRCFRRSYRRCFSRVSFGCE
jgi:hypothetical protein